MIRKIISRVAGCIVGFLTGIVTGPLRIILNSIKKDRNVDNTYQKEMIIYLVAALPFLVVGGAFFGAWKGLTNGFKAGVQGAMAKQYEVSPEELQKLKRWQKAQRSQESIYAINKGSTTHICIGLNSNPSVHDRSAALLQSARDAEDKALLVLSPTESTSLSVEVISPKGQPVFQRRTFS